MAEWVRLCGLAEAPAAGQVQEAEANGVAICLANVGGTLSALDNWCPHRRGPLGQGWLEGDAVVCPWHSWTFSTRTGEAEFPVHERVAVFPLRVEGDHLMVELEQGTASATAVPAQQPGGDVPGGDVPGGDVPS